MRFPPLRLLVLLPLAAVALGLGVPGAHAQISSLTGASSPLNGAPGGLQPPAAKPKAAAAPALPGDAAAKDRVTPADKSAADMGPTDALFDAINRGDITAARDALNRGADVHGRNLLGMSPIDLSVDLGRNDISFLLLSMGAGDSGAGGPPGPQTAQKGGQKGQRPGAATALARAASRRAQVTVQPQPLPKPALFANDGGAPQPNVGFLGFSGR